MLADDCDSVCRFENLFSAITVTCVESVRGVRFSVEERKVFVLLGPNGAGKTIHSRKLDGLRTRIPGGSGLWPGSANNGR